MYCHCHIISSRCELLAAVFFRRFIERRSLPGCLLPRLGNGEIRAVGERDGGKKDEGERDGRDRFQRPFQAGRPAVTPEAAAGMLKPSLRRRFQLRS
jgi:hypothetical protein